MHTEIVHRSPEGTGRCRPRPWAALAVGWATMLATDDAKTPTHEATAPVRFRRLQLTDKYYCDGIQTGDINRDGAADVVAGPYWYAGPRFTERHEFYPAVDLEPAKSPSNSMYSFVHDFSGDGWPDILVLGRVHLHEAAWYENPRGGSGHWRRHFAFERVRGESPSLVDVDGDNLPELVCHWDNRWGVLRPNWRRPDEPWHFEPLLTPRKTGEWPQFYHGTGIGDLNSDGRPDLLLNDGWWEQPARAGTFWIEHRYRFAARGGAQMFAYDVDGDGRRDVITSLDGHGWGLAWFRQNSDTRKGMFTQNTIMGDRSEIAQYGVAFTQPHALDLADIDGDGLNDIVVGKRMWAHGPNGDVEPQAAPVLYWFQLQRESGRVRFTPHLVDDRSGVGVQVVAADVNADQRRDILTASKLGTFIFVQLPPSSTSP